MFSRLLSSKDRGGGGVPCSKIPHICCRGPQPLKMLWEVLLDTIIENPSFSAMLSSLFAHSLRHCGRRPPSLSHTTVSFGFATILTRFAKCHSGSHHRSVGQETWYSYACLLDKTVRRRPHTVTTRPEESQCSCSRIKKSYVWTALSSHTPSIQLSVSPPLLLNLKYS